MCWIKEGFEHRTRNDEVPNIAVGNACWNHPGLLMPPLSGFILHQRHNTPPGLSYRLKGMSPERRMSGMEISGMVGMNPLIVSGYYTPWHGTEISPLHCSRIRSFHLGRDDKQRGLFYIISLLPPRCCHIDRSEWDS